MLNTDALWELAKLRDHGVLSTEEFEREKRKVLAQTEEEEQYLETQRPMQDLEVCHESAKMSCS